MKVPVEYKGKVLAVDFRCDFFVEQCIVVEVKAVQEMTSVFEAQLLTYMKLLKAPKGILINFKRRVVILEPAAKIRSENITRLSLLRIN